MFMHDMGTLSVSLRFTCRRDASMSSDAPERKKTGAARLRAVLQTARKQQHAVLVEKVVEAAVQEEKEHAKERAYVVAREEAYRTRLVSLERNMRWVVYSRRFSEIEDGRGTSCFGAQVQLRTEEEGFPSQGTGAGAAPAAAGDDLFDDGVGGGPAHGRGCIVA